MPSKQPTETPAAEPPNFAAACIEVTSCYSKPVPLLCWQCTQAEHLSVILPGYEQDPTSTLPQNLLSARERLHWKPLIEFCLHSVT